MVLKNSEMSTLSGGVPVFASQHLRLKHSNLFNLKIFETHKARSETSSSWMVSSPEGRPKDSSILESRSNGVDNEIYMHVRPELLDTEEVNIKLKKLKISKNLAS